LRARNLDLRLLLEDALRGDAYVVIVSERFADEVLEFGLAKDLRPLLIAKGVLGVADNGCFVCPAKCRRSRVDRLLIFGPNIAAGKSACQEAHHNDCVRAFERHRKIPHA
jgi:hypothetical protein